jgi:hypothetical protein
MTPAFQAIILVCLASVPKPDCSEANAVDIMSTRVANELGCTSGWQEIIARGALKERMATADAPGDGKQMDETYIKTLCKREKPYR